MTSSISFPPLQAGEEKCLRSDGAQCVGRNIITCVSCWYFLTQARIWPLPWDFMATTVEKVNQVTSGGGGGGGGGGLCWFLTNYDLSWRWSCHSDWLPQTSQYLINSVLPLTHWHATNYTDSGRKDQLLDHISFFKSRTLDLNTGLPGLYHGF